MSTPVTGVYQPASLNHKRRVMLGSGFIVFVALSLQEQDDIYAVPPQRSALLQGICAASCGECTHCMMKLAPAPMLWHAIILDVWVADGDRCCLLIPVDYFDSCALQGEHAVGLCRPNVPCTVSGTQLVWCFVLRAWPLQPSRAVTGCWSVARPAPWHSSRATSCAWQMWGTQLPPLSGRGPHPTPAAKPSPLADHSGCVMFGGALPDKLGMGVSSQLPGGKLI